MSRQASRTYPYTIENGAGEWLTFSRLVPGAEGDRVEGETRVSPGAGPPMHVHHLQAEGLTVLKGRLGYQRLGGEPEFASVGEGVVFQPGEAHRFWNAGDEELRCSAFIEPAGNAEFFLGALFDAQKRNGKGMPGLFDAAYLLTRYASEFGLLVIPRAVQRVAFPVIVALGKMLGKYDRYAHAPEPLRPTGTRERTRA